MLCKKKIIFRRNILFVLLIFRGINCYFVYDLWAGNLVQALVQIPTQNNLNFLCNFIICMQFWNDHTSDNVYVKYLI